MAKTVYFLPRLPRHYSGGGVQGLDLQPRDILIRTQHMMVTLSPLSSMFHSGVMIYACVMLDDLSYTVFWETANQFNRKAKSLLFRNSISTVTCKYTHMLFPELSRYSNATGTDYTAYSGDGNEFRVTWSRYKIKNLINTEV